MTSNEDCLKKYKDYLLVKYPGHYKRFCKRENTEPEATMAEAVIFSLFRSQDFDIIISEDLNIGGADFLCEKNNSSFLLEVTAIKAETVERQSGLKDKISEESSVFSYSTITNTLLSKAKNKNNQLRNAKIPGVLAITTDHSAGDELLGIRAAQRLLTGDTKIGVAVNSNHRTVNNLTDLKNSIFFNKELKPCRESISALLLVHILPNQCSMIGILNPSPVMEFPIKHLPSVPFARVVHCPLKNNKIETEWVLKSPAPAQLNYQPIDFKDEELRNH